MDDKKTIAMLRSKQLLSPAQRFMAVTMTPLRLRVLWSKPSRFWETLDERRGQKWLERRFEKSRGNKY